MPTNPETWYDSPDILAVTFHPRREMPGIGSQAGFTLLDIPVSDGVTIGGRFYDAGASQPVVLFFHGNGEIVADYDDVAQEFTARGASFVPVDYRGYGRSAGRPAISTMLEDARTVFEFVRQWLQDHGHTGPLVIMGRSLGSASALEIAHAFPQKVGGLIIDSGFADAIALLLRLGAEIPNHLPEDHLFRQIDKIHGYAGPTLILHGVQDRIIPVLDAEALHAASPSRNKRLLKVSGAGHNDLLAVGFREYMAAVDSLLQAAVTGTQPA